MRIERKVFIFRRCESPLIMYPAPAWTAHSRIALSSGSAATALIFSLGSTKSANARIVGRTCANLEAYQLNFSPRILLIFLRISSEMAIRKRPFCASSSALAGVPLKLKADT
jgi:hypothetical protein